jgi:hypothetical protein
MEIDPARVDVTFYGEDVQIGTMCRHHCEGATWPKSGQREKEFGETSKILIY